MAVKPDLDFDFDFGFTAVNAEELEVVQTTNKEMVEVSKEALTIQEKCDTLYNMIQPLLSNLQKNPEKEYIYWPNRLEKVEEFSDKISEVYKG